MKAWQIIEPKKMQLAEKTLTAGPGEVKVRITKAGITSTDIALFGGSSDARYPIVPVRTAAGVISEPSDSTFLKGEKVYMSPYLVKKAASSHYSELPVDTRIEVMGINKDGFMGDYVIIPAENVISLPEGVTEQEVIFTEYIAIALEALEVLGVTKNEYVVILGANPLGNITAQLAMYYRAIPIVVDTDADKLETVADCGIYYTINPTTDDCINKVLSITGGKMAEHVLIESKTVQPIYSAFSLACQGGNVGIMGYNTFVDKLEINASPILKKQLSMRGINNGCRKIFQAMNILSNNVLTLSKIPIRHVAFADVPEIMSELHTYPWAYQKVIVDC